MPKIRLRFKPHRWIGYFINAIQPIVPNGHMWRVVFSPKNLHQFHLHGIADSVTHGTFRADSQNQIVINLRSTLFKSGNGVFFRNSGQPLINSRALHLQALKLIYAHWTNFKQATCQHILNALLRSGEFLTVCFVASGILQTSFRKELEYWSSGSCNRRVDRRDHLVCLFHRRGRGDLVCCCQIHIQKIILDSAGIHGFRGTSGHD